MVSILEAIILGTIQGVAEWFPISSSGHLVIAEALLGTNEPLVFSVFLHLGSLFVILFVFRKKILELIKGVLTGKKEAYIYGGKLILATIPIAIIGVALTDFIETQFQSTMTTGIALIVTGIFLLFTLPLKPKGKLTWKNAIYMGMAQGLAILPGISRSGSTISTGMMVGVKKEDAAEFSFLMAVPAILGATVLEFSNLSAVQNLSALTVGTITSMLIGYLSLTLLLKVIKDKKFGLFGIYCIIIGILVLLFI